MKNIITVDGVEYVPKGTKMAAPLNDYPYAIIRTYSAGIFAGYVKERNCKEGIIINARRLHYWDGAASLSQLSQEGVTKPENCRFAMEVPSIELTEIIEVIPCSKEAQDNINNVPIWKMS